MKRLIYLPFFILSSCQLIDKEPLPRGYQFGLSPLNSSQMQSIPLAKPNYTSNGRALPGTVILTMPPIIDQGAKQSCVSVQTGYYVSSYYKYLREYNNAITKDAWYDKNDRRLSPEFLYNQIRRNQCERGTSFVENFDILKNKGVCSLKLMGYDGNSCGMSPSRNAFNDAVNNRIPSFERVNKRDIYALKYYISQRVPVLIGIQADMGLLELRSPYVLNQLSGEIVGQHAVSLIGYSDAKGAFLAINSWGSNWGDNGYFWISYSLLPQLVVNDEAYIVYHSFQFTKSNVDLTVNNLLVHWQTVAQPNILFKVSRSVSFDLEVLNKGIEEASIRNIQFAFVFSQDDKLDTNDAWPVLFDGLSSSSYLSPNRYIKLSKLTAHINEGRFIEDYPYLIVVVDPNDKFKEVDETNNVYVVKVLR